MESTENRNTTINLNAFASFSPATIVPTIGIVFFFQLARDHTRRCNKRRIEETKNVVWKKRRCGATSAKPMSSRYYPCCSRPEILTQTQIIFHSLSLSISSYSLRPPLFLCLSYLPFRFYLSLHSSA